MSEHDIFKNICGCENHHTYSEGSQGPYGPQNKWKVLCKMHTTIEELKRDTIKLKQTKESIGNIQDKINSFASENIENIECTCVEKQTDGIDWVISCDRHTLYDELKFDTLLFGKLCNKILFNNRIIQDEKSKIRDDERKRKQEQEKLKLRNKKQRKI